MPKQGRAQTYNEQMEKVNAAQVARMNVPIYTDRFEEVWITPAEFDVVSLEPGFANKQAYNKGLWQKKQAAKSAGLAALSASQAANRVGDIQRQNQEMVQAASGSVGSEIQSWSQQDSVVGLSDLITDSKYNTMLILAALGIGAVVIYKVVE